MSNNALGSEDGQQFDGALEVSGKLLRFDEDEGQWLERGSGTARILRSKEHRNRHWFSHRLEDGSTVSAKHRLVSGIVFVEPHESSDTHFIWAAPKQTDNSDDDAAKGVLALHFPTHVEAVRFAAAFAKLVTVPVSAVVLSDAVLFADPPAPVVKQLGMTDAWSTGLSIGSPHWDAVARSAARDTWSDALVLATPFWAPGRGKLHAPLDLGTGSCALVAASVAFDPDRELTIRSIIGDVGPATAMFSSAQRVRLDFPVHAAGCTPGKKPEKNSLNIRFVVKHLAVFGYLRHLTLAGRCNLPDLKELASLTTLRSLALDECSPYLTNLKALASLPHLEKLHFGGVLHCNDVSFLASLWLQELSITRGSELTQIAPLMAIPTLKLHGLGGWALKPLLDLVTDSKATPTVIRNATTALANLGRQDSAGDMLEEIVRLFNHEDEVFVAAGASAFAGVSNGDTDSIHRVLNTGCLPRMVELLASSSPALVEPALFTCGNVVTGNDRQCQTFLDAGGIPALQSLLKRTTDDEILKSVCWTISNITAGNPDQIKAVIDAGLLTALMQATESQNLKVAKEATWAISNATSGGTPKQIKQLVKLGALSCLSELLELDDVKIVEVALEGIDNILEQGQRRFYDEGTDGNLYANAMKRSGAVNVLRALMDRPHTEMNNCAQQILEFYFDNESEGEGESFA